FYLSCYYSHAYRSYRHSFPTRRSSDLSTVKAGSILGRALNQGSNQLAGRIQQVAPAQVQAHGSQGSRQLSAQANSGTVPTGAPGDRKSTRLNSSHVSTSYAVFCLKKKK